MPPVLRGAPGQSRQCAFSTSPRRPQQAEGFRACKRCKPDLGCEAPHAAKVADAARRIAASEETPSLTSLAARAGLSPHHFHRVFKAITGLTPKDYAAAHRGKKVRDGLAQERQRHRGDL